MKKKTFARIAALSALGMLFMQPALAVPIRITIQSSLTKEDFAPSIFGITDPSVPIQLSFMVNSDDAQTVPAGTAVIPSTGAGFDVDIHFFNASALSSFAFNVGNASFSTSDIVQSSLGPTLFDVLLIGQLRDGGVSAAYLALNNDAIGYFTFASPSCSSSCSRIQSREGYAESYTEGTTARVLGSVVYAQALPGDPVTVPEPGTLALLSLGLMGAGVARRKRA